MCETVKVSLQRSKHIRDPRTLGHELLRASGMYWNKLKIEYLCAEDNIIGGM